MLDTYKRKKTLFFEFNTALPSSASVERLFSVGPPFLTSRRNRLADDIIYAKMPMKLC